jgi:hypothetical protein
VCLIFTMASPIFGRVYRSMASGARDTLSGVPASEREVVGAGGLKRALSHVDAALTGSEFTDVIAATIAELAEAARARITRIVELNGRSETQRAEQNLECLPCHQIMKIDMRYDPKGIKEDVLSFLAIVGATVDAGALIGAFASAGDLALGNIDAARDNFESLLKSWPILAGATACIAAYFAARARSTLGYKRMNRRSLARELEWNHPNADTLEEALAYFEASEGEAIVYDVAKRRNNLGSGLVKERIVNFGRILERGAELAAEIRGGESVSLEKWQGFLNEAHEFWMNPDEDYVTEFTGEVA